MKGIEEEDEQGRKRDWRKERMFIEQFSGVRRSELRKLPEKVDAWVWGL